MVQASQLEATLVSLTQMAMAVMTVMVSHVQRLHLQMLLAVDAAVMQELAGLLVVHSVRKLVQSPHASLQKQRMLLSAVSQL